MPSLLNPSSYKTYTGTFAEAFAAAKAAGDKIFTWNGKQYNTVSEDDLKNSGWKDSPNLNNMDQAGKDNLANAYMLAKNGDLYNKPDDSYLKQNAVGTTTFGQAINGYKGQTETPVQPETKPAADTTPPQEGTPPEKPVVNSTPQYFQFMSREKVDYDRAGIRDMFSWGQRHVNHVLNAIDKSKGDSDLSGYRKQYVDKYGGDNFGNNANTFAAYLSDKNPYKDNNIINYKPYTEDIKARLGDRYKNYLDESGNFNGAKFLQDLGIKGHIGGSDRKRFRNFMTGKSTWHDEEKGGLFGNNAHFYKSGGQLSDNQEKYMQAFRAFLVQKAKKTGAATDQAINDYIKGLGENGLKKAKEEFDNLSTKALHGAKLDFINKLNGQCPQGYKLTYHKVGGKVCKVCEAKDKELHQDPIKAFKAKCGKKLSKRR